MPIALIVDADVRSRALHASLLRRIPGISVIAVGAMLEGLETARIEAPSVVMTGGKLPDGTVPELIDRLWSIREPACVLIALDVDETPPELPSDPRIHCVTRPIDPRNLRKLVERSIRATLDRMPLFRPAEYLQLLCLGGHSAGLQCFVEGVPVGEIKVKAGQIWAASDSEGDGEAALRRVLSHQDAVAQPLGLGSDAGPRTVQGRWEALLLEAAYDADETRRTNEPPMPSAAPLEVSVDDHLKAARSAVIRGDLQEAATHFEAAALLMPEDRVIRHNLERLNQLGYGRKDGEPNL